MNFYEMVEEACHEFKKEHEKVIESLWVKIRGLEAQLNHATSEYQTLLLKKKEPSVIMLTASESLAAYQGLYENADRDLKKLQRVIEEKDALLASLRITQKEKEDRIGEYNSSRNIYYNRYVSALEEHNKLVPIVRLVKMGHLDTAREQAAGLNPATIMKVELP